MVYLDYTANTPAEEAVLDCFCQTERSFIGNANSAHEAGSRAAARQSEITASIARMLNAAPDEIIYTSGATESNNLAVRGTARALRHRGKHILTTPLEHSSVSAPLTALQEQGWEVEMVKLGRDGKLDSVQGVKGAEFQKALSARGVYVSVKAACSSDSQPSRAVFAVSRDRKNALCSWRISLSHRTTEQELAEFLTIFDTCYKDLTGEK